MGDACGRRTCLPAVVCEGGAESVKKTGRLCDYESLKDLAESVRMCLRVNVFMFKKLVLRDEKTKTTE